MTDIPNRVPWLNIAVGIMTIVSPYAMATALTPVKTNLVITGIIIAVVAILEMAAHARSHSMNYWPVINILAGLWLFISTTMAAGNAGLIWSNIVLGVCSIVTAIIALSYERMHSRLPAIHT